MTSEERNHGYGDETELSDRLFRMVSATALLLGALSGGYTLSTSDDRYRAADASKDLALRDAKISALQKEIEWLKYSVERINREGPDNANASSRSSMDDHERRIDELEKENIRHNSRRERLHSSKD